MKAPHHSPVQSVVRRLRLVSLLCLTVLGSLVPQAALAQDDFGQRDPSRHIYDLAGVLTTEQVERLEKQAGAIAQRTGSPVVVYMQSHEAGADETEEDARELMDAWDVQSGEGVQDGIIIFFNLEPDDPEHGSVTLLAGQSLDERGTLPQYEVTALYEEEMQPLLEEGDMAGAIAAGLDGVLNSLTVGPRPAPEPSAVERIAGTMARYAVNGVAIVAALVAGFVLWPRWQHRPQARGMTTTPTVKPPELISPAVAGALAQGNVTPAQAEAVMLDLARRGLVAIEPDPSEKKPKTNLRLLGRPTELTAYEQAIWRQLTALADADGIVRHQDFSKLRSRWGTFQAALKDDLTARGWFNPDADGQRRPFFIVVWTALGLAIAGFIITALGEEPLGMFGVVGLVGVGLGAWALGASYSRLTVEGQHAAAPWRGYRDGLKGAKKDRIQHVDLDAAVPYATAMGITNSLSDRLKRASKEGYVVPGFHLQRELDAQSTDGFYPYWVTFHAAIIPNASSTTSTSTSASSGASSAGGNF